MKSKTMLWMILAIGALLIGFPVLRFIFVHLKEGYDEGERQAATRPAVPTSAAPGTDNHPAPAKPAGVDFDKLDFAQNSTDVHNRTDRYVENLPPLHGGGRNSSREGGVGQGSFEVRGHIESLQGASLTRLPSASHAGGLVTLELDVERGIVRAYLVGLNGHVVTGNVFVDASPGHPGRVTGYLNDWSDSGTPEQTFVLEARDGEASGVSYRVYRK